MGLTGSEIAADGSFFSSRYRVMYVALDGLVFLAARSRTSRW